MTTSALAVALLALSGTALVAPSAAAAPPLDPPTVSIAGGDLVVSEVQSFTVSDIHAAAAVVSVTYAGHAADPLPIVEGPGGTFTATGEFETWGMTGDHDLVVAQCADEAGTGCGEPTTVSTMIDNPVPTHDLSRPGSEFAESFDLTMNLAVAAGSPRLRLTRDSGTPVFIDPGDVTPVDTDALAEGAHQVAIALCSADELRCTAGGSVPFTVVRTVPGTFSVSAPAFSPNGAGLPDTIDFDYAQSSEAWDSASVEVRAAGSAPVLFDSAVPLPESPSDGGSFTYDGKDDLGAFLPDGDYQARLVVTRTLDSGDAVSSAYNQVFTVDSTAKAPLKLTPSVGTFYPHVDGYRDTTKFTYIARENYSRVDLQVFDADFDPVLTKLVGVSGAATWSGRDDDGARVPAAQYQARLRVVDDLGNVGFTPPATVTVSNKKLVTVTKAVTVTPKASRVGGVTGACSTRRTPSLHGWTGSTGYLSNTRCRTTFNASIVWTRHRIHLPSAVTYRWVRLGWYGGPTRVATRDRAIATLYGTGGAAQGWFSSVDYMASQYIPSVTGSRVVDDGDVSWGFQTDHGNRYDVKTFTITYRADVLR